MTTFPGTRFETFDIDKLHPSPFNRRREWGSIDELAASIKTDGILEPLLVRQRLDDPDRLYEVIAGERRLKAAKSAGLTSVPVLVLEATDEEAMRISAVENLQRENPHPLDEADSYRDLQKENKANTVPVIAALVGKAPDYIYRRLRLHSLSKKVRESFDRHEITVAHAELLARLDPEQQKKALAEACHFQRMLFAPGKSARYKEPVEPAPLGELDDWIERNTKIDPASTDAPNYFPELADQFEEPDTLLQLSASDMPGALLQDKKHGLVGSRRWVAVKGKPCKFVRKGVIVHGGPLSMLDVCVSKACGKHHPKVKRGSGVTGAPAGDAQADQDHREAMWQYEREGRQWKVGRHAAVGDEVMRVALEHVPTDAITPALGRLLLSALPTSNLEAEASTAVTLPANEHGGINISELADPQVITVIVMSLAQDSGGWFDAWGSGSHDYAGSIALLTGLGVADPKSVIAAAKVAYADANPAPKKPRAKKAAKKGAK